MTRFARVRRFLDLSQRDVSVGTGILISRISGAERGVIELTVSEKIVLREFLERRLRVALEAEGEMARRGGLTGIALRLPERGTAR